MTRTNDAEIEDLNHLRRVEGGIRGEPSPVRPLPLVSIIVVAFRDRDEVAALIDNIAPFRGDNLELVIVDGGSGDGTLELLQARNEKVDYWVSEPDGGIYDAMNKGIAAASGEYILHLNAGDRLHLVPTSELAACQREKVDVAAFRVQLDGGSVHIPKDDGSMRISNVWHHQGTFYRRSAHLGYDPSYRVFGDFDHNQRMAKTTNSIRVFRRVISSHGNPGLSSNKENFGEIYKSIRRNSGVVFLPLAFLSYKLNGLLKRLSKMMSWHGRQA